MPPASKTWQRRVVSRGSCGFRHSDAFACTRAPSRGRPRTDPRPHGRAWGTQKGQLVMVMVDPTEGLDLEIRAAPGAAPPRPPLRGGACHTSLTSVQSLRTSSRTPSASPAAMETASPAPSLRSPAGPSPGDHMFVGSPHSRAHVACASRSQPGLPGHPTRGGAPSPDHFPHIHRKFVVDIVVGLPC